MEIFEKLHNLLDNFLSKIEFFTITNKEKLKIIYQYKQQQFVEELLSYFLKIITNVKTVDLRELIYEKDELGYSIIHYVCSLSI